MLETSDEVTPAHPAATVILMRDAPGGPEVLLVQRSNQVKHMGGMWVFPGGRVDPEDDPGDGDPYGSAVNAAIRETREEAGLVVMPGQLEYLSHWTTPQVVRKRFATWFFLTVLEDDQEVQVDGGEIALHRWASPRRWIEEHRDAGTTFRLLPPTYVSLLDLADHADCAAARAAVAAREPEIYAPNMVPVEGGSCFLYQGDAGYEAGDPDIPGARHRTYMIDNKLEYIRECS